MNLTIINFIDIFSLYIDNFYLIFIALVILFVLLKLYYPKIRGFMGEFLVKQKLNKLPKDKYIVLNDIMIGDENGTHQIDHIVLSNFGIFVIETKNYKGLIKGRENDNKWCQYLGKTRKYFVNPIHQNFGHIRSLSKLLEIDENYFISIICFSNRANVDVICNNVVTQLVYLKQIILKYNDVIYDYDINKLANIIMQNNIIDKKIRKEHIMNIRIKVNNDKELVNNMICPKCGSALIERNGKYGKFIGCTNFPKCRYIIKGEFRIKKD